MKLLRMKTQLKKLVTSIHYLFLPAYIALIFVTAQSQKETANLTIRKPIADNQRYTSFLVSKAIIYFTTPYITQYSENSSSKAAK
jgi:NADH:ubiquinone oxidoreductase subunit 2 (subunit N)